MTRNRLSVSLLMLVGCLAVGDAWAESALCLAEGGKTTYTIVRDDTLGKDYDFVIGDFIGLLEKATAVKFKVVMPPDAPVEKRIKLIVDFVNFRSQFVEIHSSFLRSRSAS